MWDYKVVSGTYSLDGGDVVVENNLGRGTLQRVLDHYGSEGFDLVSSHYDPLNREVIILLKKPKPGFAPAVAAAPMAAAAPAASSDDDELPRRRKKPSGGGRRRSKAELDRLYRDT